MSITMEITCEDNVIKSCTDLRTFSQSSFMNMNDSKCESDSYRIDNKDTNLSEKNKWDTETNSYREEKE